MSTFVKDIGTFRKHVKVTSSFKFEDISSEIVKAERKHIKKWIGRTLYDLWKTTAPADGIRLEVYELLQEASAAMAICTYVMKNQAQITNGTILIADSEHAQVPTLADLFNLRRAYFNTATEAIDEALLLMEEEIADFPEWFESDNYTYFNETFTRHTSEFNKWYTINNSRLTFLRLRPHLRKVEDQYFESLLGPETVLQIKQGQQAEEKKARQLCIKAQVPLAVASVAYEGVFRLTSEGLFTVSEELPYEKKTKITEQETFRLKKAKENEGIEQLKKLVTYLKANPGIFVQFAEKLENQVTDPVINNKSILSV